MAWGISRFRMNWNLAGYGVAVMIGAAVAGGTNAAMSVFDPTVNASVLKTHAEAVKQLEEARKILAEAQKHSAILGAVGKVQRGDYIGGAQSFLRSTAGIAAKLEEWNLEHGQTPPEDGGPAEMRSFLEETTIIWNDPAKPPTAEDRQTVETRRLSALADGALNALSIGLAERGRAGQAASRLTMLAVEASNSVDLRSDVATTNKILLQLGTELVAQRQILAALLEYEGARGVRETPVTFGRVKYDGGAAGAANAPLGR